LLRGRKLVRKAASLGLWHSREQPPALHRLLAEIVRNELWVVVVVAQSVGPPDVVEHEKGKRLLPSGLDDQAKLLRNGVVVVVAIDHVSVGPREMPERLVAGLLNQLNVGPLLGQRHQLILGGGVDRQNPSTCGVSP